MHMVVEKKSALIDLLALLAPSSSKTTLRSWIKEGRVSVNGQVIKRGDVLVETGQTITVGAKAQIVGDKLRVVYEDSHLIAIEKPSGLLSVAAAFEKGDTVHAMLKKHFRPRPVHVVHRLDQDTSGVMLFALSSAGYEGLKELFKKHDIERRYVAIVEGKMNPPSGTWQSYLHEDSTYTVHSSQDPKDGVVAITHYEVQNVTPHYTRLALTLETGRKNQIRVHCAENGHPVVGDKKYGAATDPLHRLCLHAELIAFVHPVTGKAMRFSSPAPDIFNRLIKLK